MTEEGRFKTRVAYRTGATPAEIAESTEFTEEEVEEYVNRLGLEQDKALMRDGERTSDYGENPMEAVNRVYDEWQSPAAVLDSTSMSKVRAKYLSEAIAEEQPGKVSEWQERRQNELSSNLQHPPADEDSLDTFLAGQRYISEDEISPTEAAKWYIERTGGQAPEGEVADFLEMALQYRADEPTGRFLEKQLGRDDEVSTWMTEPGIEDPRYKGSERVYALTEEPELDAEVDEFLNESMLELSDMVESERSGANHPVKDTRMKELGIESNGRLLDVLGA